jgi:hypothetical protein
MFVGVVALGAAVMSESLKISSNGVEAVALPVSSGYALSLRFQGQRTVSVPGEGLWSIATNWDDKWQGDWSHGNPGEASLEGDWLVLKGEVGDWHIRDSWRIEGELLRCTRRWEWHGESKASPTVLSVRFRGGQAGSQTFLPGICQYGNPSGVKTGFGVVAQFTGKPGENALFQEHRYPMPFASLEDGDHGSALHSLPSSLDGGARDDLWWSIGVAADNAITELTLLSGPVSINGQPSMAKATQRELRPFENAWIEPEPGAVYEKTFWLEAYDVEERGSGFQTPMKSALKLFNPADMTGMPKMLDILKSKHQFALSRWHETELSAGINMYPDHDEYVMGWAGQSGAPGAAFIALHDLLGGKADLEKAQKLLDHLTTSPFNEHGFLVRYLPGEDRWHGQDPVSQGQGMENIARAILASQSVDRVDSTKWSAFLKRACEVHAERILADDWRPVSTNEAFIVSPLLRGARLFNNRRFADAGLKAAEHYAGRHLDMTEPYWGGTLDARCEDKEGAWAGFQAFLAAYEHTEDKKWLKRSEHAMDVTLSNTVIWDVDMPAGRLRDHNLKTRGWTIVSVQNQHLDVLGVMYTPEIYRMGKHLDRQDLKDLALLMYRSCGQMIDAYGSQGEQLNHTNFSQWRGQEQIAGMRGTYSEAWTVFWITAHFMNAGAEFRRMGLDLSNN